MRLLEKINSYADFKAIDPADYYCLAEEIREYLNEVVAQNGGHLASNLGVVELTLALHNVFDFSEDRLVFDVGHQAYVHKIITGRREALKTLRTEGGVSGFPRGYESDFDAFDTGHSSTSISAALGLARARDLKKQEHSIVALIGDGALTGGLALEGLNDLGTEQKKMIVVLNDNKMSISKNVGAMSNYLSKLRVSRNYTHFKHGLRRFVNNLPLVGEGLTTVIEKSKNMLKFAMVKGKMFEQLGINYIGPIDGHDIDSLISFINHAKNFDTPVILHVLTDKGKGNELAENNPSKFHGVSCVDKCEATFSTVAGETLTSLASVDKDIVAFTAAMPDGTGLTPFAEAYPERFFDVGIAEEHAVTCAAGMAKGGAKPYVAVYSSFLQRAFDQIIHDVCMPGLPVTFLIDRAGIVGEDGASHQGLYDLSYLRLIPGMTIISPKDTHELKKAIEFSTTFNHPLSIRYPKNSYREFNTDADIVPGKWEIMQKDDSDIAIIATGNRMLSLAMTQMGCTVINALFIKPLDTGMLDTLSNKKIIILEENTRVGGLYAAIAEYYAERGGKQLYSLFVEDIFVRHGSIQDTLNRLQITQEKLGELIKSL